MLRLSPTSGTKKKKQKMDNIIPLSLESSLSEKDILLLKQQNITNIEQLSAFLEIGSSRLALSVLLDKPLEDIIKMQINIKEILEKEKKDNIKDIIKNTTAKFEYAVGCILYYKIIGEKNTYIFPVNMLENGTTRFEAEYKSIHLMRWLRKSIENGEVAIYPTIK